MIIVFFKMFNNLLFQKDSFHDIFTIFFSLPQPYVFFYIKYLLVKSFQTRNIRIQYSKIKAAESETYNKREAKRK